MLKIIKYLKSGLALSAIVAMSMGLSSGSVAAADEETEDDKKEGQRVVKVDCNKGDEVQDVLDKYAFETKILVLVIEGRCEIEEPVEVTRNNVEFVGAGAYPEQRGYIAGLLDVQGGRGVYIGDNMELDNLNVEYGQVFLDAGEGTVTIYVGLGVNYQSVLTIGAEDSTGSVVVMPEINLINQSLLLIQPDENASNGSVTTGNINASLQSAIRIRAASIGDMNLGSDSHAYFDSDVTSSGEGLVTLGCDDNHSRYWGVLDETVFDVDNTVCIGM